MSYRKKILVAILVIIIFGLTIIFGGTDENIVKLGFCDIAGSTCTYYFGEGVIIPILLGLLSLFLTLLFLLPFSEYAFKSWRKFTYFAIPISIILLWLAPTDTGGGFGISFFSYTKESASWLVSGLFLIISLIIIIRKQFTITS